MSKNKALHYFVDSEVSVNYKRREKKDLWKYGKFRYE